MKIIGFNFNKINIERKSDNFKGLKIDNHIDLVDVKKVNSEFFSEKETPIEIKFKFSVKYTPDIADISLSGSILTLMDKKTSKLFLDEWKDKKLPDEHKVFIFNIIMKKSSLKALELEDDLNLPLHVSLPSIREIKKK